jgi:hypothetical protein
MRQSSAYRAAVGRIREAIRTGVLTEGKGVWWAMQAERDAGAVCQALTRLLTMPEICCRNKAPTRPRSARRELPLRERLRGERAADWLSRVSTIAARQQGLIRR